MNRAKYVMYQEFELYFLLKCPVQDSNNVILFGGSGFPAAKTDQQPGEYRGWKTAPTNPNANVFNGSIVTKGLYRLGNNILLFQTRGN
jgi:hypothetical protein